MENREFDPVSTKERTKKEKWVDPALTPLEDLTTQATVGAAFEATTNTPS